MNLEYFPHFCPVNFPQTKNESNDSLIELGEAFKQYLLTKFDNDLEKLDTIWNIDLINVATQFSNPLREKGYHLALLHFNNFIKSIMETNK